MPVVLTTSYEEGPNGPIAPGLKEMFPDANIIKRQGEINTWDDPNFVKAVEAQDAKNLSYQEYSLMYVLHFLLYLQ